MKLGYFFKYKRDGRTLNLRVQWADDDHITDSNAADDRLILWDIDSGEVLVRSISTGTAIALGDTVEAFVEDFWVDIKDALSIEPTSADEFKVLVTAYVREQSPRLVEEIGGTDGKDVTR
jgi:hypothetical protein